MTSDVAFLRRWYGDFIPHLTAIVPDGPINQERDRTWGGAARFFAANAGVRNLYYSVNAVDPRKIGKAKKGDIAAALGCHVDIDFPEGVDPVAERQRVLARLQAFSCPPSVIIFSGGGYNALWRFAEPLRISAAADIDAVEAANRGLQYALEGDDCHNIDRILRMPGTLNLPNAKKRARGRVPTMAAVETEDWSRTYTLADLPHSMARTVVTPQNGTGGAAAPRVIVPVMPASFADLGIQDHVALREMILRGEDTVRHRHFPSRSELVWHVVNELIRIGVPDEKIVGTLLHPRLAISASVLEKRDPGAYAAQQVVNARFKAELSEFKHDPQQEAAYERAF